MEPSNFPLRRISVRFLAVYGCIATGIIYVAIGVVAMLSFLKFRDGGADENSVLMIFHHSIAGVVLIWIILIGTFGFICWRFIEAIKDPYHYGRNSRGIMMRLGIALSTIADALIVNSSVQVLIGIKKIQDNGLPIQERAMFKQLFEFSWGHAIAIIVGLIILVTALVQLYYGFSNGYKDRFDASKLSRTINVMVKLLAKYGYAARAIILAIIGWFVVEAGVTGDADRVVNTDKAFDFIGDNVGGVAFIVVAVGTVCYGLFMFALAHAYRIGSGSEGHH